jgi:flavin reductase (DIM6/NTAB) family NADH-FMN oxidoreductase RutF
MQLDPGAMDPQDVYKLMAALIVPRPIAWTSTLGPDGTPNLAPFSFFMMITSSPPHVAISVGAREGQAKDTLRNVRDNGELVINIVDAERAPQMAFSASELVPEINEFEWARLEHLPSDVVRPRRVAGAPASFECQARQIIPVGDQPYGAHLIISEVVQMHIRDDLLVEGNRIDLIKLNAVGRLTGDWYCSTTDQYQLPRQPPEEW